MSERTIFRWNGAELAVSDRPIGSVEPGIAVADSWLVSDGLVLALGLHRARFLAHAPEAGAFWDAAIEAIPRSGDWFPRVEASPDARLQLRLRQAPERTRSVVVATWAGADPRTVPGVKGPDLERMLAVRTAVQPLGAGEAVLLSPERYVIEGAYSGLLWWRGDVLCGPPAEFERVDSVTARSVITLAGALGFDVHEEAVTPYELDGVELWALSALHGIRIVTGWVDGPKLAERPSRLESWRSRLDALRRSL